MKPLSKILTLLFCAALFAPEMQPAASARYSRGRGRRTLKITKGKPAVEYVGTIKSIATNGLTYRLVVEGSSNSSERSAPKGSATFDVSGLCRINTGKGSAGSFSDLSVGRQIGIHYTHGLGDAYQATAIDLNPPAASKTASTKKRK